MDVISLMENENKKRKLKREGKKFKKIFLVTSEDLHLCNSISVIFYL